MARMGVDLIQAIGVGGVVGWGLAKGMGWF